MYALGAGSASRGDVGRASASHPAFAGASRLLASCVVLLAPKLLASRHSNVVRGVVGLKSELCLNRDNGLCALLESLLGRRSVGQAFSSGRVGTLGKLIQASA